MASSGETFALDLKAFVEKAKGNVSEVVRKTTQNVVQRVVLTTPVGLRELWAVNKDRAKRGLPLTPPGYVGGRLRANWNVSLVSPDTSTTDKVDPDGSATIARAAAVIAQADGKQDIWIMNSLPYAIPIEYGHSNQAPAGMVRITVADFQESVNAAAASLANE